jgi:hypothetical protein
MARGVSTVGSIRGRDGCQPRPPDERAGVAQLQQLQGSDVAAENSWDIAIAESVGWGIYFGTILWLLMVPGTLIYLELLRLWGHFGRLPGRSVIPQPVPRCGSCLGTDQRWRKHPLPRVVDVRRRHRLRLLLPASATPRRRRRRQRRHLRLDPGSASFLRRLPRIGVSLALGVWHEPDHRRPHRALAARCF